MKNNQMIAGLVALLFFSTLASGGLIYRYFSAMKTLQRLQPQMAGVANDQNVMQSLLNEVAEYQKTAQSPELQRILEDVPGAKQVKTPGK
jgi:hypothetical protein